jgi:hypothetical protein
LKGIEMRKLSKLSAGLACLGVLAAGGDALAKSRHYGYSGEGRRPLVVERRSFLDPGAKVPVGSTNRYMLQQTFYNQDPIQANQRSWYGGETLPRRLDQPWDPGLEIDFLP